MTMQGNQEAEQRRQQQQQQQGQFRQPQSASSTRVAAHQEVEGTGILPQFPPPSPPRRLHLPPPPPPPRRAEFGWEGDMDPSEPSHNDNNNNNNNITPNQHCLLTVQFPQQRNNRKDNFSKISTTQDDWGLVQIHLYPQMTSEVLAKCVSQAITTSSQYVWGPTGDCLSAVTESQTLVGLFGRKDGIFHSFTYILSLENPAQQIYSTVRMIDSPTFPEPWWWNWVKNEKWFFGWGVILALVMSFLIVVMDHGITTSWYDSVLLILQNEKQRQIALDWIIDWFDQVHDWLFMTPIREWYRYGPYVLGGWEGLPLEDICGRMTHYYGSGSTAGRDFWKRNLRECEELYHSKEETFLRMVRPISYGIAFFLLYRMIASLVIRYGETRRKYQIDPAALETYQAIQTLAQVIDPQRRKGHMD